MVDWPATLRAVGGCSGWNSMGGCVIKGISLVAGLVLAAGAVQGQSPLTTIPPNNGGSVGWGLYFDLTALSSDLLVTGIQSYFSTAAGSPAAFDVLVRYGGFTGFTNDPSGWTTVSSGSGLSAGTGTPSEIIPLNPPLLLQQGQVLGVCLLQTASGIHYFGTGPGIQVVYETAELRLFCGVSKSVPFTPRRSTFDPRVFSGSIHYESAGCYPDCDTSTGPGVLDIFDFLCFGNRFNVGDPYACDCDTSTGPGVCDIFDFLCLGNAFNAGCS